MKKLTLCVLFALALALLIGIPSGWTGRGIGAARVFLFPRDAGLLAFADRNAPAAGVLQVPFFAFDGQVGSRGEGLAADLEDITGVRPKLDVDSVLILPDLQVARGRYDWERTSARLRDNGYRLTEVLGRKAAIKDPQGDTIALADPYLLHGSEQAVRAALLRKDEELGLSDLSIPPTSAKHGSAWVLELDAIGWRHAAFAAVRLSDEKRSVADVLDGKRSLKAAAAAIDLKAETLAIRGQVRPGSRSQAEDLKHELRQARDGMVKELVRGAKPEAEALAQVLEKTSIEADAEGLVLIRAAVPRGLIERVIDADREVADLAAGLSLMNVFSALGAR